jgi:2OG-Fe(II) oxygenase superfamily
MSLISSSVLKELPKLHERFTGAKPFKHVCVDEFLRPEIAEALLSEFPKFDSQKAINEHGKVGGKAVHTDIRSIGHTYQILFDYLGSTEFLDLMSDITGIPKLIHDVQMYGGGTHENLHGQELDPHVDFNYSHDQRLHRRVNLLIYLNTEWCQEWGGGIELHSDPRNPNNNEIAEFNCNFNRCVLFETNEHSWHGFRRINLPPDKRHLSRKCVSIYLYTAERPLEEIAPLHGTFYVQRPLSSHIEKGYCLTDSDINELNSLLEKRDAWISFYQNKELAHAVSKRKLRETISELETTVKQLNNEVDLRGQILDKKRKQLLEEQTKIAELENELTKREARINEISHSKQN